MSDPQPDTGTVRDPDPGRYCSISDAMKLLHQPFDGDKKKLKEFVDNVTTAFELVNPTDHVLLLKFVKTKITGEARSKLLVRDLTATWSSVKEILEENYGVRRTLDYYACRMFNSRQGSNEGIASWSSRIDTMQSELREAAYRVCEEGEAVGAMALINHLAKACFVQGLTNDRIQTIVRSKGETALLSTCIDVALEEESAILSARERGFSVHRGFGSTSRESPRVSVLASDRSSSRREQEFKGSGRGPGFIARVETEGLPHPGRGVNEGCNRGAIRRDNTNVGVRESSNRIRCYACGDFGHVARSCPGTGGSGWKKISSGNGQRIHGRSPGGSRK
jgi:hypothetical protein